MPYFVPCLLGHAWGLNEDHCFATHPASKTRQPYFYGAWCKSPGGGNSILCTCNRFLFFLTCMRVRPYVQGQGRRRLARAGLLTCGARPRPSRRSRSPPRAKRTLRLLWTLTQPSGLHNRYSCSHQTLHSSSPVRTACSILTSPGRSLDLAARTGAQISW